MITGALLSLFAFFVSAVAFVLPSGSFLPSNFSDLFSNAISYAYGFNWLFPMTTLFSVLGVIIVFYIAEFAWRGGKYFIGLLRGN